MKRNLFPAALAASSAVPTAQGPTQQGGSLIEVLVAVVVLSIGLLGVAALQAQSIRFNHDALLRSSVTELAHDIADRIRANRSAALEGSYDLGSAAAIACDVEFTPSGVSVAADDLAEWRNRLACQLPGGRGEIARNDRTFTLRVIWDESRGTDANQQFITVFEP